MARILVVEDDLFIRELYVETLTSEKYEVEYAVDGQDAFKKIKQGGYDLILLDIIMPKMDGLTVMRKIAKDPPQKPNKLVIFLTNLDDSDEIRQALELGNGYLIKSQLTPADLLNEVKMDLEKLPAAS